jgi:predicted amidohydrolase
LASSPAEDSVRVAAAQIECRPADVKANLDAHLAAIQIARSAEVDLVVFPELSLTDYLSEPDVESLARPRDADELQAIADAAGPATVSVGFIERGADGRAYNAQALLSDGACRHVHRKANLPTYGNLIEGKHYAPGRAVDIAAISAGWNCATLICADTWNPALPWLAAVQGAEILILPVASSLDAVGSEFDNPGGWDINLRHTALTYGLPLVMVNHCGRRGGLTFWGGSRILDPFGREVARAGDASELVIADLEKAQVTKARQILPTVRDADPELVHDILTRVLGREGR